MVERHELSLASKCRTFSPERAEEAMKIRNWSRSGRVEILEARKLLSTVVYTVTDTSDSVTDTGSLRYALTQANALASTDHAVITFDLGSGVQTIKVTSALPTITGRVDILGPTDSSGDPLLVLDGADAGAGVTGLTFDRASSADTAASLVSGLIINNFSQDGIDIEGSAPTDVFGCWIGTDSTGKHSQPNDSDGINIFNNDDKIGQEGGPAYADLISGNGLGIFINSTAVGDTIQDCRIGTDVTGRHALGNSGVGIVDQGSQTLIGGDRPEQGNVVSGNEGVGIVIDGGNGGGTGCILYANLVGTNAAGTAALGNAGDGVVLQNGADDNEIGDNGDVFTNTISGNAGSGITLFDSNSNAIEANVVGLNENTDAAIPNGGDGIDYFDSSNDYEQFNTISGNKHNGVLIEQVSGTATGNEIGFDTIGLGYLSVTSSDTIPVPNGDNGVEILNAPGNTVRGCKIENNKLAGVEIKGNGAVQDEIEQNNIYANGLLGICLGADTDTPLPINSMAGGPNSDQNYPVLTSAVQVGANASVDGTLSGLPAHTYKIEFFVSPHPDPSGFGQGLDPVAFASVTADGSGNASFTNVQVSSSQSRPFITAVAIDTTTSQYEGDTSEFSQALKVSAASISGTVFNDANGDGKQDDGEKGLANETVFVDLAGTGTFDNSVDPFATTNSAGQYTIFGVPPGKAVHVLVEVPSGDVQTEPGAKRPFYKVTLAADGSVGGLDFGIENSASNSVVVLPAENGPGATAMIDLAIGKGIDEQLLG
jgi:SdrD B-like protein/parallel beta helix pectate lyase-like protein